MADANCTQFHIAICDDLQNDREQIAQMTRRIMERQGILCDVASFDSGNALLSAIQGGKRFQLLLLDVMMDEMDGMELADELHRQGNHTTVIFISINREMALYGYERNAVRYLAKPLEKAKLEEALMHCCTLWQEKKEILLPTNKGQYRISFSDIQFVEAFDRGTRFYFNGETVECNMKFGEVEAWLPQSLFLLCHRAFIVNLSCVKSIKNYEFALESGSIVPIGKNRYSDIYKRFVEYISA